jgi:membrane-bound lytic murein transglycosylase D
VRARTEAAEPVTETEASEVSPSLGPGGAVARATEAIDLHIGADDTIRVAAEETLSHYAEWLGVSASRLRSLNSLGARTAVPLGQAVKLDFSRTPREAFEARRRSYHETLQAAFFSAHRIVGTHVHVARSGDSLWAIAQRNGSLPTWLVLHYNPKVRFGALRAGQQIVIPKVEALPPA